MTAKNEKGQHLCALDCANVCRCPYALSKKKEPEKYKGLVVEPFKMWDDGSWLQAYRVTKCPHYIRDKRAIVAKEIKPILKNQKNYYWTEEEIIRLRNLYGKMPYLKIAKELSRTVGSVTQMIKKLKECGVI